MSDILKTVIIEDELGTRAELQDEYGVLAGEATEGQIREALVTKLGIGVLSTDELNRRVLDLVKLTDQYNDDVLIESAHRGMGTVTGGVQTKDGEWHGGDFKLIPLSEVNTLDRDAYEVVYGKKYAYPASRTAPE